METTEASAGPLGDRASFDALDAFYEAVVLNVSGPLGEEAQQRLEASRSGELQIYFEFPDPFPGEVDQWLVENC